MGFWKLQENVRVGFLGMPSLIFGREYVDQLGVDVEAFRWRKSYKPGFQTCYDQAAACCPLNVSLEDHLVHCAVTAFLVDTYRATNPAVTALWKELQRALKYIELGEEIAVGQKGLVHTDAEGFVLPNGMKIRYHHLRQHKNGSFTYLSNRKKHEYTNIYGGKCTENLVQALARLVLSDQLLKVVDRFNKELRINPKTEVVKVASSTHDELISVVPARYAAPALEIMKEEMAIAPSWCPDMPLKSSGGWAYNYGDCEK
jgi:hypothetical protein